MLEFVRRRLRAAAELTAELIVHCKRMLEAGDLDAALMDATARKARVRARLDAERARRATSKRSSSAPRGPARERSGPPPEGAGLPLPLAGLADAPISLKWALLENDPSPLCLLHNSRLSPKPPRPEEARTVRSDPSRRLRQVRNHLRAPPGAGRFTHSL